MSKTNSTINITNEEYNNFLKKVGEGYAIRNGSMHPFIINNTAYKLTFLLPGMSAGEEETINFVSNENNILKYKVGNNCEFSIQELLEPGIKEAIILNDVIQEKYNTNVINFNTLSYKEKIAYCNVKKLKITYKYGDFIMTTQNHGNESLFSLNFPDLKKISQTYFERGEIHFTNNKAIAATGDRSYIYAVDKKGNLYIYPQYPNDTTTEEAHHSYILKGKIEGILYGFGRPTASSGIIIINDDGKIKYLDNNSGHYLTDFFQTLIVAKKFKELGILANNCLIKNHIDSSQIYTLQDLDNINEAQILGQYKSIDEIEI